MKIIADSREPMGDLAPKPSLTSRTFSGLAWTASANFGKAILRIFVLAIMARLITPREFGVVNMALIVVGLSDVISAIGVGPAIVQRQVLEDRHVNTAFVFSVLYSTAIGIGVYFAAPQIASWFAEPELVLVIQVLSCVFPIRGIETIFLSLVHRRMNFRGFAGIEFFSYAIGYAPVGISLAILGYGVWSLVAAQFFLAVFYMLGCMVTAKHPVRLQFSAAALKDLLSFGSALSLGRLGTYVADNGDYFVVGSWLGSEPLGLYSRAFLITSNGASLLATVIERVLFPVIATVQNDKERLGRAYRKSLGILAAIGLPLNIFLVLVAPETVRIVLGANWSAAILPYQILVFAIYPRIAYRLSATLADGTGAIIRGAWRQWLYTLTVVTAAWFGHFYGITGVAVAVTLAVFVHFAVMVMFAAQLAGVRLGDIAVTHFRHLNVALLVGAAILPAKFAGSLMAMPDVIVVGISCISAMGIVLLMVLVTPNVFGDEGRWIMSAAAENMYGFKNKQR